MTFKIGQQVLFHPLKGAIHHSLPPDEVRTATVAHVLPDGRLNLSVIDKNGESHAMTEVPVIENGKPGSERGYYIEGTGEAAKSGTVPVSHAVTPPAAVTPPLGVPHAPPPPAFTPKPAAIPVVNAAPKPAEVSPLSTASKPAGS